MWAPSLKPQRLTVALGVIFNFSTAGGVDEEHSFKKKKKEKERDRGCRGFVKFDFILRETVKKDSTVEIFWEESPH